MKKKGKRVIYLIYPPAESRHAEAFSLPNISLAVLSGFIKRHYPDADIRIADLDILFHSLQAPLSAKADISRLNDKQLVQDFISGRSAGRKLQDAAERLFDLYPWSQADLYCFTLIDLQSPLLVNICAVLGYMLRKRFSAPIIIGNGHIGREIMADIMTDIPIFDYAVFSRDGGSALVELIKMLEGARPDLPSGILGRRQERVVGEEYAYSHYDKLPAPDYDNYPVELYRVTGQEILSRYHIHPTQYQRIGGRHLEDEELILIHMFESTCSGRCAFCSNEHGSRSDRRGIKEIVNELKGLKRLGATGIFFMNPNFNDNYKFASGLCDAMTSARLGLLWADCVNFRNLDEELLKKMRASGAVRLTFGLETGSDRLLSFIHKATTARAASRLLQQSHQLGIWNHLELIGGLPTENEDDIAATIRFINDNKQYIDTYSLNPFSLYRNSPFYITPGKFSLQIRPGLKNADHFSVDEKVGCFSERFDEIGGLAWPEKNQQIKDSTRRVADAIAQASPPVAIEAIHIHLLFWLYRYFGYQRKEIIRTIMRTATKSFRPYFSESFVKPRIFMKGDFRRILRKSEK